MESTSSPSLHPKPDEELPPSSASTSDASDSDVCNTEGSRIYFGPVETPERNFVARTSHLFPPTDDFPTRRQSPRLSKARDAFRSPPPDEDGSDDAEDMDQVARIVADTNAEQEGDDMEEGEEDEENNQPQSPVQNTELLIPDEPSSALANKILHAMDNPSPPPSPPPLLAMFDPYHTSKSDQVLEPHTTVTATELGNGPLVDLENPLLVTFQAPVSVAASPQPPVLVDSVPQGDLISFDSPIRKPTISNPPVMSTSTLVAAPVEDLLTNSPAFSRFFERPNTKPTTVPDVNIQEAEDLSPMDVTPPRRTPDRVPEQPTTSAEPTSQLLVAAEALTPLRRSPRPRRSVTPNPVPPAAPPSDPETPSLPILSRTRVKKKGLFSVAEAVDSDMDDAPEADAGPSRRETSPSRRLGDRRQSSPRRQILSRRELGSLSPTSSSLLNTLGFAKAEEEQEPQPDKPAEPFSFSVFQPPPVFRATSPQPPIGTPVRPSGPMRIISPVKPGLESPTKFKIHAPALDDPTNTPARRVFIGQPQGQDQPPLEKPPLPALLTPARRVLVPDPGLSASSRLPIKPRSETPGKPSTSKVAEPSLIRSVLNGKGKERAMDRVPGPASASNATMKDEGTKPIRRANPLPYPIVPGPAPLQPPAPEVKQAEVPIPTKAVSPPKSSLRKPTSKIPRIGMKPYVRVTPSKTAEKAKAAVAARVIVPPPPKPSAPSTSAAAPTRQTRPTVTTATASSLLKRKRDTDKTSPVKPRTGRPVLTRRAELPPKPAPSAPSSSQNAGTSSRTAPPDAKTVPSRQPPLSSNSEALSSQPSIPPPSSPTPHMGDSSALPPGSPMNQDQPPLASFGHSTTSQPDVPPPFSASSMTQTPEVPAERPQAPSTTTTTTATTVAPNVETMEVAPLAVAEPRRTTRSGRRVAGSSTTTSDRPSRAARRAASSTAAFSYQGNDVFSTMSMTALKDLTAMNTAKNQHYVVAKLETEVIKREGDRPDSPLIKIKSVAQRQQEERERQRAERAQRRARRSSEDPNGEGLGASSDVEFEDVGGYSSPCEEYGERHQGAGMSRHVRGPGDDDDFVTPEKPDKVVKKTRVIDGGEVQEYECVQRRVKWDKGLFTTVYLDQVKMGARQTFKENTASKGILAPHAKALRLDTLGNLVQGDTPLLDLVPENIIVKKIVYASDEPPVEEVVVVKNTRSRGKKK